MKTAKEPRARVINEAQETVLASEIKTHPRNPRRGKVEAISESIHANGFYGALVVNKRTKHILAGNHRFLAGKDLGMDRFPVFWVDVDRAEEERILAADNRTSDLGGYDNEALAALLEGLRGTDEGLSGTGYDDADLDALLEGLADEALDGEAQEASPYTNKIVSPVYEPTGRCPEVSELAKLDKYLALKREIDASDLPADVRAFLLTAAQRHVVFHFANIAEYYCHASKEVQRLFENSALVIIDYNRAVENGFVALTETLGQLAEEEGPTR